MEAPFRDVDLPVQAQPLFVLNDVGSPVSRAFRPKASMRTLLPTWTVRLLLIGIDAVFGSSGYRLSLSITTSLETPTALSGRSSPRCAPRNIHATIEGKQVWCSLEYNIWRYIHSYHRRHGDTHFTALRCYRARQFSIWLQSASPFR